jgi:hypothetical protein
MASSNGSSIFSSLSFRGSGLGFFALTAVSLEVGAGRFLSVCESQPLPLSAA